MYNLSIDSQPVFIPPSLRVDMEEGDGGETVFPKAWPPEQSEEEHVNIKQVCDCKCLFLIPLAW